MTQEKLPHRKELCLQSVTQLLLCYIFLFTKYIGCEPYFLTPSGNFFDPKAFFATEP